MKTTTAFFIVMFCAFLFPSQVFSSTGDCEGELSGVSSASTFDFIPYRKGYISFWDEENIDLGVDTISVSGDDGASGLSVCIVNGVLSNWNTMSEAILNGVGKKMYVHNNRGWAQMFAINTNPMIMEGKIKSIDHASNSFVITYIIQNSLGGAGHGPDEPTEDVTINYSESWMFKDEGVVTDETVAVAVDKHVRVYSARKQTIHAFIPDALIFDHPTKISGDTEYKSWVQKGFLRGYYGGKVYFAEYRNGEWIDSYKDDDLSQAHMVETHYMNSLGASARAGDRAIFVPYAMPGSGWATKQSFFRSQDDETIEGTITNINGSDITLEVVNCPTGIAADVDTSYQVVTLEADAKYALNGIDSTEAASIQVGNYLRVMAAWDGAVLARDINTDNMTLSTEPTIRPFFVSENELELSYNSEWWQQADTIIVTENATATFEALAFSPETIDYQWYKDGNKIPGAQSNSLNYIAYNDDNGAKFTCVASNSYGTDTCKPIFLLVQPDTSPLTLAGASIADNSTIQLSYNKEVEKGTGANGSENISNYSIDQGISVNSVTLIGDKKTVIINTSTLTSGNTYTITVNNVQDVSQTPNVIASNSTIEASYAVKFRYLNFILTGKGSLNPKIEEISYIQDGIAYGSGKTYFGIGVSNPEAAFDNDGGTAVSTGLNDEIGVDLGAGFEIAPDSIMIQLDASNGRDIHGFRVEGSVDYTNWHTIFEADTSLNNGGTYFIAFDLSSFDPDSILTGAKTAQTITFPAIGDHDISESPITLDATASSDLTITYYVLAGPGSVSGNTLTLTDTGTVFIQATQDGNDNYYAAYPVEQSFQVGQVVNAGKTTVATSLNIWPNPCAEVLNVQATEAGAVEVFNVLGEKVLQQIIDAESHVALHLYGLKPGMYIVKLGDKTVKLIKE